MQITLRVMCELPKCVLSLSRGDKLNDLPLLSTITNISGCSHKTYLPLKFPVFAFDRAVNQTRIRISESAGIHAVQRLCFNASVSCCIKALGVA